MDYRISLSPDIHTSCTNSSGKFYMATEQSIKVIKKILKEPSQIVLFSVRFTNAIVSYKKLLL